MATGPSRPPGREHYPYIFTGLQIAMGVAWFSLVAGEQRWAARHERWTPVTGDFAWFWLGRAKAAKDLLLAAVPVASPSTR